MVVGKVRTSYFREGCEDYLSRIRKLVPIETREIKPAKDCAPNETRKAEGLKIIEILDGTGWKSAALDDRGKTFDSESFARFIGKLENSGAGGMIFIVGGAYGLSEEVLQRCDYRVSLGPLTMSHELARLVLFEQIYRAQSILRGMPYPK